MEKRPPNTPPRPPEIIPFLTLGLILIFLLKKRKCILKIIFFNTALSISILCILIITRNFWTESVLELPQKYDFAFLLNSMTLPVA